MKIAVLYGGVSKEREVSISTSKGIMQALTNNGHDVIGIDFHPKKLEEIIQLDVDLVFIGLHGKFGEDGSIQAMLDMLEIPYVGSDVLASALAMDKYKAKQLFQLNQIPAPKGQLYYISKDSDFERLAAEINETFTTPFVVKPNREGSTVGLSIVKDAADTKEALKKAYESDHYILVEEYIDGIELTVPILGNKGEEQALPIIEIIPKNEIYDYESKYSEGGSEHIIPARISDALTKQIQQYAVLAHRVLGCETYSRVDFLLKDGKYPYILEVNTLPGMTPTSLFPDSAKAANMSYDEMVERLVQLTLKK